MMNLLIIDDNPASCEQFISELENHFNVFVSNSPNDVLEKRLWKKVDIFLVDIHLPGMRGDRLIKYIKEEQGKDSVFLLITADEVDYAIKNYYSEISDDFIHKAISPIELCRRLEVSIARKKIVTNQLVFKNIHVCLFDTNIKINDEDVDLTHLEYKIFVNLIKFSIRNKSIKKDLFIDSVWKKTKIESKTVNTHIGNLNKKLKDYGYRVKVDRKEGVVLDEFSF